MKNALILLVSSTLILFSCGGKEEQNVNDDAQPQTEALQDKTNENDMSNKGIGPVTELKLDEKIDQTMVEKGKQIYTEKCKACHKENEKYIGPAPAGILERRSPEWIMNMILNPEEMVQKDPIAKELLKQFISPMANQNLTEDEARFVLEYFRTL